MSYLKYLNNLMHGCTVKACIVMASSLLLSHGECARLTHACNAVLCVHCICTHTVAAVVPGTALMHAEVYHQYREKCCPVICIVKQLCVCNSLSLLGTRQRSTAMLFLPCCSYHETLVLLLLLTHRSDADCLTAMKNNCNALDLPIPQCFCQWINLKVSDQLRHTMHYSGN
jgi:hypothetical protein